MSVKTFLILSFSACLVKVITCQCLRAAYNPAMIGPGVASDGIFAVNDMSYVGARGLAYGAGQSGLVAPASGGGFAVTSSSPIAPIGLRVASENVIEGVVAVTGDLPVLSAVALEAALPTAGSGAISYGCGDGSIGITSELGPKPYAASELPYSAPFGAGLPYRGASRGLAPLAPANRGCNTIY